MGHLLKQASLKESDLCFNGPALGRSFVLQLKGEVGLAGKRVRKILQLQRSAGSILEILTASESFSKTYLDLDKNRFQQKTEIITKKLASILMDQHRAHSWTCRRSEGIVFAGMLPVARVLVESQSDFALKLNIEKASELDIPRQEIEAALRSSIGSAASRISWG